MTREMIVDDVIDTDSYKTGHFYQYPKGMTRGFCYMEGRPGAHYGKMMSFGTQFLAMEYLTKRATAAAIKEAAMVVAAHGDPFPYDGWMRIVDIHEGRLPLRISAVPEGTVVPIGNAILTAETQDPEIPWLAGWFETQIVRLWYPMTVATRSYYCKKIIREYLEKTSNDPDGELPYKLHDFGGRGVTCREQAGIGGLSHLVNFMGSDTLMATIYANRYYGTPGVGVSIPAMEHSTVTAWGREHEEAAFANMIDETVSRGIKTMACVSDTYDVDYAVENYWGGTLHEKVKESGSMLVIRPDSGDPIEINLRILRTLERKIGMKKNFKGYKVLPAYYRLIQGDGNEDESSIAAILEAITAAGFSASNIAFGMGGGLLQKVNRDTQRIAFKLSELLVDGNVRDVRKNPKTSDWKASKAGRLDLVKEDGEFKTIKIDENSIRKNSELITIFENGNIPEKSLTNFADVRKRALS